MDKDSKIRENKIKELIEFLNENDIWLVEQSRIGSVKITNPIKEEFLYDGLIESIFTEDDTLKIKEFFKRAGIILISPDNFYGASFRDCLLNEEELYNSILFESMSENEA